jgi:alkanesulfonate monooxygenase SsuD/methylene tetrahydromethanopterin reductase-like flavin-dependent oxidoreductase (luciferase family)
VRFGSFVFSISGDARGDHQVIENTLREVELAEAIGLDAVWLTEHHFDGAVAYADPLVFGAAVAMKTQRVRIGFAVVELALHHPVRLAVQTAVLDHLSQGRLIVGTGRGSAYNAYEYIGFGTTMEQGNEMLPEAEALLVKAWTEENVRHEGRFWNVAFPELRPRPYQQPHPPLVRACISEPSVAAMSKLARPVLIGIQTVETLRHRLQLYRDTMLETGFSAAEVEMALDQNWAQRGLYVSENDAEALETADLALQRYRAHLLAARQKYNPGGEPPRQPGQTPTAAEVVEHAFLAGSPQRVAEQIAELREAGVRNLLLNMNVGQISPDKVERSMRLFGDKVLPMAPS